MKLPPIRWKWLVLAGLTVSIVVILISCVSVERTMVAPPMIAGATYVGMETCAACHEKIVKDFKLTSHARIEILGEGERVQGQGCESCHGAGSLHVEAGGGRKFIVNPGKDPTACFQCHLEKNAEFKLQYHHPVIEGKMSCTDCHDPHGADIHTPPAMFVSRSNSTCAQCHREQARPRVFEHEALREGCQTCHNVHGSINEKMLVENNANLCLKCHAQVASASGSIFIGARDHASFLRQGGCWSAGCHTAMHGSDINPHLRY